MVNGNIVAEDWFRLQVLPHRTFICGYCGSKTGNNKGYFCQTQAKNDVAIYICPVCGRPSFYETGKMTPGSKYGQHIDNLPETVESIYEEARSSYEVGAFTGVILICRKILANVAINFGAKDGLNFVEYVDYLIDNGYVPENSRTWIDEIRTEGNSATHNQTSKNQKEAEKILDFVEMLLLINFKFNRNYVDKIEKSN